MINYGQYKYNKENKKMKRIIEKSVRYNNERKN